MTDDGGEIDRSGRSLSAHSSDNEASFPLFLHRKLGRRKVVALRSVQHSNQVSAVAALGSGDSVGGVS